MIFWILAFKIIPEATKDFTETFTFIVSFNHDVRQTTEKHFSHIQTWKTMVAYFSLHRQNHTNITLMNDLKLLFNSCITFCFVSSNCKANDAEMQFKKLPENIIIIQECGIYVVDKDSIISGCCDVQVIL